METNRGRQAIDKPLARRIARHIAGKLTPASMIT
jgi:hypothetical protein